jgi:hypothetical protein
LKLVLVAVPVSRWQLIVISLWFCLLGWFMPLALHPFVV